VDDWMSRWNGDPVLLVALAVSALAMTQLAGARRSAGLAGVGVLFVAFVSPPCALTTALFAARRGRFNRGMLGLATAAIFALPLIEAPSLLGLGLAALGLSLAALIAVRMLPGRLEQMPVTVMRFLLPAPTTFVREAKWLGVAARQHSWQRAIVGLLAWVVPLGLGLVFVLLFAAANPLIEVAVASLRADSALELLNPVRLVFWLIMAAAIWAFLRPKLLRRRKARQDTPMFAHRETVWFGQAAILRSLIIFNASTWHGHTENRLGTRRRSIQAHFVARDAQDSTHHGARMRSETLQRIDGLARYVLGVECAAQQTHAARRDA
jgi:hypothetical protein